MDIGTATLIAEIGEITRNYWPEVVRNERLKIIQEQLSYKSIILLYELVISFPDKTHVRVNIDGQLSVYNTDLESDIEPITIELLKLETIQRTIVETFQVRVVGNETNQELLNLITVADLIDSNTTVEVIE